jgi:hypothetical protein
MARRIASMLPPVALLQVLAVGRDHHPSARDLRADQLGLEALAPRDVLDLGGDDSSARLFDLRHGASILRGHRAREWQRAGPPRVVAGEGPILVGVAGVVNSPSAGGGGGGRRRRVRGRKTGPGCPRLPIDGIGALRTD